MKYERLLTLLNYRTNVEVEKLRAVFEALADLLRENHQDDEVTRTPLGYFYTHVRPSKEWILPDGSPTQIPERIRIQLRPSARMTRGWEEARKAHLNKLVRKYQNKKNTLWNPVKILDDEDDGDY